jgi:hypothetical protein
VSLFVIDVDDARPCSLGDVPLLLAELDHHAVVGIDGAATDAAGHEAAGDNRILEGPLGTGACRLLHGGATAMRAVLVLAVERLQLSLLALEDWLEGGNGLSDCVWVHFNEASRDAVGLVGHVHSIRVQES